MSSQNHINELLIWYVSEWESLTLQGLYKVTTQWQLGGGGGWVEAGQWAVTQEERIKQEKQSSTTGLLEKGQGASHRDRAEVNTFRQKDGGLIMTDHSKSKWMEY